jgi:hypothetical protein
MGPAPRKSTVGQLRIATSSTIATNKSDTNAVVSWALRNLTEICLMPARVPEIVAAHASLQSRGVEFINAPHMIHKHADGTEEWMAFFKDPEGRTLALMSQARAIS